ncbi:MAG: hypothetical protein ABJB12_05120 [Pseudomonadota bacterium]
MVQAEIACLAGGKIILLSWPGTPQELHSAYAANAAARSGLPVPFVDVARGRRADELCYTLSVAGVSSVFTQVLGSGEERRLFSAEAEIRDLDLSFADEALTCTVQSKDGSSAIGLLGDDGKGMRTVTEGEVIDREPRWAPGGRGEIVYASAGIGRTKAGSRAGFGASSLHRLNLAQSTVEVLVADAKYDYFSPVPLSDTLIYAIRRPYRGSVRSPAGAIARLLAAFRAKPASATRALEAGVGDELVRITESGIELVASGVLAFDASATGVIVYSSARALFRLASQSAAPGEQLAELSQVEQLVIC